jgi:hypothetical protein
MGCSVVHREDIRSHRHKKKEAVGVTGCDTGGG